MRRANYHNTITMAPRRSRSALKLNGLLSASSRLPPATKQKNCESITSISFTGFEDDKVVEQYVSTECNVTRD